MQCAEMEKERLVKGREKDTRPLLDELLNFYMDSLHLLPLRQFSCPMYALPRSDTQEVKKSVFAQTK